MATLFLSILISLMFWRAEEPSQPQPAVAPPAWKVPPDAIELSGTGAMTFLDKNGGWNYDVMWGPRLKGGDSFKGYLTLGGDDFPPQIHVRCGFVYVSGRLKKQTISLRDGVPIVDPWPTIIAGRIRVAAEGTTILVEVSPRVVSVFRLSPFTSKDVWVTGFPDKVADQSREAHQARLHGLSSEIVTFESNGNRRTCPRSLSEAEDLLVDAISGVAKMNHVRRP